VTARARKRRRGRRRTILTAAIVVAVAVGAGLYAGGVILSGDDGVALQDISGDGTTTSTTTAPTTTTTTATTTTTTAPPPPPPAAADGKLEQGEHGEEVSALQARLVELGFWLGTPDGTYGQLTRQAVMAFQKAQGLGRDGVAGPATLAALPAATRPAPREPSGSHLEIDLDRQLLFVVQDGQALWVINTSTGNGEAYAAPGGGSAVATTPRGSFTIQREIDGLREAALGTLYRPKYFHGGIAIHGSGSIPAQPASHGCARLTNAAMDMLWSSGVAVLGTPVLVY
jgi:peptidoglycan hydrolase-like protein with peptidoglycan-binding domain